MALRPIFRGKVLIVAKSLRSRIAKVFKVIASMKHSVEPQLPVFDPSTSSTPISLPIKTLKDLASLEYFSSFHFPFNKSSFPLQSSATSLPDRSRLLVCHDMQGGYGDDKWSQGGANPEAYSIWHWNVIDVFVYFSHHLVTVPPPGWINTAHRHGVKVLGTFITEWGEGMAICEQLLDTKDSATEYAERLAELAAALGFDGWLLNVENPLRKHKIPNMKHFVEHLTQFMHFLVPGSLVIWYDSVTIYGDLQWQDYLNEYNRPFFDSCDGIFVNYTWESHFPELSAAEAGDRKFDVYTGIDVFGRNTFGGGQWNTKMALDVLKKSNVSAAIFAPGWIYETRQPPSFEAAQCRWWKLIEQSWGRRTDVVVGLPFYTNFDRGSGYHISVGGEMKDVLWNNMSCQGYQPLLETIESSTPDSVHSFVDINGPSYDGGGNITFKGTLENHACCKIKLFERILVGSPPIRVTFSVKSADDSRLGLFFLFSSTSNKKSSVCVASGHTNNLSEKFPDIIEPELISEHKTTSEWMFYDAIIPFNGDTLDEVYAVCYNANQEISEVGSDASYCCVLGHVSITSLENPSHFPPLSSWLVEAENLHCSDTSEGYRKINLKLKWRLMNNTDFECMKYYLYVSQVGSQESLTYLGVAHLEAFYISEHATSPDSLSLKFFIQPCNYDGTYPKLEDCPYYLLNL